MAIIEKKIKLVGSKGSKSLIALFDSGASYSHIKPKLAEELGIVESLPQPIRLATAKNGEEVVTKARVTLDFWIDGYRFSDEFMVVEELSEDVIIGVTSMQKWRMKLDFEKEEIIIDPRVTKLRLT
jgi:predicted aspartyl protease